MALESATYISDLVSTNPTGSDGKAAGDDHIRLVKSTVKASFPNVAGAVTSTHTELSGLAGLSGGPAGLSNPVFAGSWRLSAGVAAIGGSPSTTFITQGLAIDQGAYDDEALSLRSTDVSHGMTSVANAVSFGTFTKYHGTEGGIRVIGYSSASVGMFLRGSSATEDSTRSTLAVGSIMLDGAVQSGSTVATKGANTNVVCIRNGSSVRFIFDSDGDSHQDVGTAWTNYDHLDDVATLDALAYNVARKDDPIKRKFGEWMNERRDALTEQNLVRFNDDGHHFVNMSKLTMLHTGAIRQMGEKLDAALKTIENLSLRLENKNA